MIEIDPGRDYLYTNTPNIVLPATEGLGVTLSPEAIKRQQLMARAIGLIDLTLDDPATGQQTRPILEEYCCAWRDKGTTAQAPEQLHPELIVTMQALRKDLTSVQAKYVVAFGFGVLSLMDTYRSTTNLKKYVEARRQEGRLAAAMMLMVTPEAEQRQPNFEHYARRVTLILGGTNLLDSFEDFQLDRKQGEIALPSYKWAGLGAYALTAWWSGRQTLGKQLISAVWNNAMAVRKDAANLTESLKQEKTV